MLAGQTSVPQKGKDDDAAQASRAETAPPAAKAARKGRAEKSDSPSR